MQLITCTHEEHADAILRILNEVIVSSTALFDYEPRAPQSMVAWFGAKALKGFPVVGAFEDGRLLGFATYGTFRTWPAYKYSVEHSVYVDREARGRGVGLALMRHLIEIAEQQSYHNMIAGIVTTNSASIALHERLGFVNAGTIRHAGFKFGEWLDLAFYQLLLNTPEHPRDG